MKSSTRRTIGLVVVVIGIILAILYLEGQKATVVDAPISEEETIVEEVRTLTPEDEQRIEEKASQYPLAPELTRITEYIVDGQIGESFEISDFRGNVVLIDFWTYSCINCIRTLPHLVRWHEEYADKGLVIIGVHTPEFQFEKDTQNVIDAMARHNITYLVAQDNDKGTWRAYKNRFWPRKYLIDQDGFIRYDHIGEGAYGETEIAIRGLLDEIGVDTSNVSESTIEDTTLNRGLVKTPELYAGYDFNLPRGQNIGNPVGLQRDMIIDYRAPPLDNLTQDAITLDGLWESNPDNLFLQSEGSVLLSYQGREVNIVASSASEMLVEVTLDEELVPISLAGSDVEYISGKSYVRVQEPRLYNIISGEHGRHVLTFNADVGFNFNAFTFG